MYEMGPTAAGEGCRGEVPRKTSTSPPQGLCLLLSRIPTGRGAVPRTARRALGWISQSRKTHLYGICKKWAPVLTAGKTAATHPSDEARAHRGIRTAPGDLCALILQCPGTPAPAAAPFALFSYTPRPGCSAAHGPAGSAVDFPIPQNSSVCVLQKNGLPCSRPRRVAGRALAAWGDPQTLAAGALHRRGAGCERPERPTLYLPYTSRAAYPIPPASQPAYPTPACPTPTYPTRPPSGLPAIPLRYGPRKGRLQVAEREHPTRVGRTM
jgi:hypothetical protein